MRSKWLLISVALNLIGIFAVARHYYILDLQNKQRANFDTSYATIWNRNRTDVFSLLQVDSNDIVFVGTSLTEGFPVTELFTRYHIKNRGIGNNKSSHILSRIGKIAAKKPRLIVLEMGINDLLCGIPPDTIIANFDGCIDTIHRFSPNTRIIMQSILPTAKEFAWVNASINQTNSKLAATCARRNISFVNINPCFRRNDSMDSSFTLDGIHVNGAGYSLWEKQLQPYIK